MRAPLLIVFVVGLVPLTACRNRHQAAPAQPAALAAPVEVSDQEARRFFDSNTTLVQSEYQVEQIMTRHLEVAEDAKRSLALGTPFETVAAKVSGAQGTDKPWQLGAIKWTDLPLAWHQPLAAMQPGQTSGIIKGRGLYWIVRLVARTQHPDASFDSMKDRLLSVLRERAALPQP